MPLEQPIAKGATLRVRDAARQASLVSCVPPPNQFFPSGSPVDSEPPSTSSDASTPPSSSSSSAYDSPSDIDSDEGSDDNNSAAAGATPRRHNSRSKFDSGLLPNNKSAKACTPCPSVSSASSIATADDYFSAGGTTFLGKVYPRSTQVHRAVSVSAGGDADSIWKLAVLDHKDSKSLYAKGAAGFEGINLRENLVDLLDLADEELDCDRVVVVLDKSDANLGESLALYSIHHPPSHADLIFVPRSSTVAFASLRRRCCASSHQRRCSWPSLVQERPGQHRCLSSAPPQNQWQLPSTVSSPPLQQETLFNNSLPLSPILSNESGPKSDR